jgi:transposase-like protein
MEMKLENLKVGNCQICGSDMPIFNKRQRFCCLDCKNKYWIETNSRKKRAERIAALKHDLFGSVAAE